MQTKIIAIGTSKGVRIPKYLLEKYELTGEINLEDTGNGILIKPSKKIRAGWETAANKLAATKKNTTISLPTSDWDKDEWEW